MGPLDQDVLELNRRALSRLHCPRELIVIPGATHLLAEPGALEEVADLATDWFRKYLVAASPAAGRPSGPGGPGVRHSRGDRG